MTKTQSLKALSKKRLRFFRHTLTALFLAAFLSGGSFLPASARNAKADEVFTPNANLVVEGVPQIPRKLAEQANKYTASRAATFQSWHPTRREMLISTRFSDTVQIHRVEKPGGARTQLTFFPDRVDYASYQPGDGKYFIFLKDENGDDRHQLYRYDLDTGDVTKLTEGQYPVFGITWSHSGKWLLYCSPKRNGKDSDIYLIDPLNPQGERRLVEIKGPYWEVLSISPDDRKAVVYEFISSEQNALWLIDIQAGSISKLTPPPPGGEKVAYWNAAFSADGKGIFLTSDQKSEVARLAYLDSATGKIDWLVPDLKWGVESLSPSPDGKRLAYVTNEEGVGRLHLFDLRDRREQKIPDLPTGIVSKLRWRNRSELSFNLETARYPSDIYSLDADKSVIERWTKSETGGVNTDSFSDAKLIRWSSFDRRDVSGFLYLPPARFPGPRPVIIDIHGGPQLQARPSYAGRYNYYLNELGIAVIFPNVRGSDGFSKSFLALDNGPSRADAVKDIGALLDWIKTQPQLDSERVMLRGDSYGGYLALAVAAAEPTRLKAVMTVSAITSLPSYIKGADNWVQDLLRVEYGDERQPEQLKFMEQLSPRSHVGRINVPLFLAAGSNDVRVTPAETEQMVRAAQAKRTPVWYLLAKDEGHIFGKKINRDYLFFASVLFIRQFLLG